MKRWCVPHIITKIRISKLHIQINFFQNFKVILFCFLGAIFDLVHDVEAIQDLC